jgi:hypothetical protein
VPARAGLNRFVWDFRLPKAAKIETKGGDQPGRDGPKVVPGTYQIRLTIDGVTQTESFAVKKDPRVATTPAEYTAQFELLSSVHRKHDALNKSVNSIRAVRTQAIEWARRVKDTEAEPGVVEGAKLLSERLDAIEGELLQVKIQSEQDSLNYPVKLNSKLAALAFMVGNAEAAPTTQAGELFADLAAKVDKQLAELGRVLAEDVPGFNRLVAGAGVDAIVLGDDAKQGASGGAKKPGVHVNGTRAKELTAV